MVRGLGMVATTALLRREPARFSAQQRRGGPGTALVGLAVVGLMIAGSGLTIWG